MQERSRWSDWLELAVGAWLFISPWALGYTGDTASEWTAWVLGLVVAAIAVVALVSPAAAAAEGLGILAGVALFVAPWLLGYSDIGDAATNSWLFGIVIAVLALIGYGQSQRAGHAHTTHGHGSHA